jgi:hypothetical protein
MAITEHPNLWFVISPERKSKGSGWDLAKVVADIQEGFAHLHFWNKAKDVRVLGIRQARPARGKTLIALAFRAPKWKRSKLCKRDARFVQEAPQGWDDA